MARQTLLAGLELGTHHFVLAVGEWEQHPRSAETREHLVVKGIESVPAQGVAQGVLSDAIECSDTVARLIRQAERKLSCRIPKVVASFHGNHLKSYNATASIPVPDPTTGITRRDVERALTTCRTLSLEYDRQLLHAFERGFAVDNQTGIQDPVGLCGTKLTAELHLVTALTLGTKNLIKVLNRAGLEVEELVLPGLAAAEAVLSDLDKDLGVTLIRIGDFETQILLFSDGNVRETFPIPWGTDQLAESAARTFKLPRAAADQLLEQVNSLEEGPPLGEDLPLEGVPILEVSPVLGESLDVKRNPDAKENLRASLPLRIRAGSHIRSFHRKEVAHWMSGRLKDLLGKLQRRLEGNLAFRDSASGVVMVGNLARLEGFLEMAEGQLNMPVRLGVVREVALDPSVNLQSLHTTAVGLLRYGVKCRAPSPPSSAWAFRPGLRWLDRTRRLLEDYF